MVPTWVALGYWKSSPRTMHPLISRILGLNFAEWVKGEVRLTASELWMGHTYLARPGAGHGNSCPHPEASEARPQSHELSLPSVGSPASHKPVGVGGIYARDRPRGHVGRAARYYNRTATEPVRTRTQWTCRSRRYSKIPAKQQEIQTHEDGLERPHAFCTAEVRGSNPLGSTPKMWRLTSDRSSRRGLRSPARRCTSAWPALGHSSLLHISPAKWHCKSHQRKHRPSPFVSTLRSDSHAGSRVTTFVGYGWRTGRPLTRREGCMILPRMIYGGGGGGV
jgi:hypothetical protein